MPPRKTTDFGALFESLIEDLRIQVAASVDNSLSDLEKRLARLERRLDQLDPSHAAPEPTALRKQCTVCGKESVARGMCSAHYQQWRYRVRKSKTRELEEETRQRKQENEPADETTIVFKPRIQEISRDN